MKAIFHRGVKHAEEVRDSSKSCVSVMFCGSAAGVLSFPYVVIKGPYIYPLWTQDGPDGAVYSATISGWFDIFMYCDRLRQGFN